MLIMVLIRSLLFTLQVEFMFRRVRHANGPKGVVLGDDMGLGKTVQIIALFSALLKKSGALLG